MQKICINNCKKQNFVIFLNLNFYENKLVYTFIITRPKFNFNKNI